MVTKMEVRAYIGAVKKVLWHVPNRQKVTKELHHEVEIYLEQNPDATMADVYKLFGTPEAVRAALIADMAPDEVDKQIKRAKIVRTAALVTAAIIIVLFVLTMAGIIIWNYYHQPMFITQDIFYLN